MYNSNFKEAYISERASRNVNIDTYLRNWFEKTESLEEEYEKDLYDWTTRQILSFYKELYTPSLETIRVLNAQFERYVDFALANNVVVDCQNHFAEINNDALATCVNWGLADKKIFTRKQLLKIAENGTSNPCEEYLLLAIFEGICGKHFTDIANLTADNFHDGEVFLPSGKHFPVSKELLIAMNKSVNEYTYYAYTKNGDLDERQYKAGDPKVIKEMFNTYATGEYADQKRVYNRLVRIAAANNLPGLTSKALLESGRIDLISRLMTENNTDDVTEIIKVHRKQIEYKYGEITSIARYLEKFSQYIKRME